MPKPPRQRMKIAAAPKQAVGSDRRPGQVGSTGASSPNRPVSARTSPPRGSRRDSGNTSWLPIVAAILAVVVLAVGGYVFITSKNEAPKLEGVLQSRLDSEQREYAQAVRPGEVVLGCGPCHDGDRKSRVANTPGERPVDRKGRPPANPEMIVRNLPFRKPISGPRTKSYCWCRPYRRFTHKRQRSCLGFREWQ
jgi:hypothetical protein